MYTMLYIFNWFLISLFCSWSHNMLLFVLFCTIICIIFTSLCKKLVKLTWWCIWHRKASAKNSSKFNKFLAKWSENNTYYSARSRLTKQQHVVVAVLFLLPSFFSFVAKSSSMLQILMLMLIIPLCCKI